MVDRSAGAAWCRGSGRALLAAATLALAACGGGSQVVEDRQRGYSYRVPDGWSRFDNELRSRHATLFESRVYELDGAARDFVAGLPESVVPQLERWAREYFVVDGTPERVAATIGGEPALVLRYPVRVRASDPPGQLTYWVVRHGTRLYVLRAALRPGTPEEDVQAIDRLLETWRFLDSTAP
jgi:hypothetical protein